MNKKQKFIETGIKARSKNQGRSNRQVENNYKLIGLLLISFAIVSVGGIIYEISKTLNIW
jgi:hypothetical protein